MRAFNFLSGHDINQGIKEYETTPGAILLDVRTPDEYAQGHIKDSINLPLLSLRHASERIPNKNAPVFVYCRSGSRSAQAVSLLEGMGYTNVQSIGGIRRYKGKVSRS